jgi:hypothetical protein
MAKLHDDWQVLPHGLLRELAPGLLTVVGQIPMPLGNFSRRMTVVALARKRTAIFSPVPLAEAAMARIEALGAPAYLIVPNGGHRLDLRPFHKRYPDARIVTAPGAKTKVKEAAAPVQTRAALGDRARLITLAGCGEGELAMLVRDRGEVSLLTNDVIGHVVHPKGPGAWLMSRLMGFGPKPRITRPARWFFIKDKAALASQFRGWAKIEGLRRLIPSHGEIIDRPAALLERLAAQLDRG